MIRVVKWKELFTRAEVEEIVVDILTEIQLEIEECEDCGRAFHLGLQMASKIIQKKIDKLKGEENGNK